MGSFLTLEEATKAGAFTVIGGVALKIIQVVARFFIRKGELKYKTNVHESDYQDGLRDELRKDLDRRDKEIESYRAEQRTRFDALEKEVKEQEQAVDEWKRKYWELFQQHAGLAAQIAALTVDVQHWKERFGFIEEENKELRGEIDTLLRNADGQQ